MKRILATVLLVSVVTNAIQYEYINCSEYNKKGECVNGDMRPITTPMSKNKKPWEAREAFKKQPVQAEHKTKVMHHEDNLAKRTMCTLRQKSNIHTCYYDRTDNSWRYSDNMVIVTGYFDANTGMPNKEYAIKISEDLKMELNACCEVSPDWGDDYVDQKCVDKYKSNVIRSFERDVWPVFSAKTLKVNGYACEDYDKSPLDAPNTIYDTQPRQYK
jgi:hypothetical protein